jgi:bifunctional UDP-N-acetylglucosamine pyrophosphorylase/glucosamine-1-phosphate N-acetyltransferase
MASYPLSVVVLAAGEGKRMHSDLPKVLHPIAGQPMLGRVLDAAQALAPSAIHVVHGHAGETVKAAFADAPVNWVYQAEQLGTGHAVMQALAQVPDGHQVLVLCADVPLISAQTLRDLVEAAGEGVSLLSVCLAEPRGYGRVLRDADGAVMGIVEEKDATDTQRQINEVNTGVMCLPAKPLRRWLSDLDTTNAQGEYYLTDCIAQARRASVGVQSLVCDDPWEVQGVNDRLQLAAVERACQRRQAETLMREHGLGIADPSRFDLRGTLSVGRDCFIEPNVIIEGTVSLGDRVTIGPSTRLLDTHISSDTAVLGHCEILDTHVGAGCQIGPFARLRPGTVLADKAKVGNFVETKKAQIGSRSKVNHLSYIGDAELGEDVNVGAGTITCNYDGQAKHLTKIGNGVFIGSNTALVAPVAVGDGAMIGAGTTIRDDVPSDTLAVTDGRARQIPGWQRPHNE